MKYAPESLELQPGDISVCGITKQYGETTILDGITFDTIANDLTLVSGPSGSGKTTLLNIMSGIMRPDEGRVCHGKDDITAIADEDLTNLRAVNGYAFQRSGLIGGLTARANIILPNAIKRTPVDAGWTAELCEQLDIVDILDNQASKLSGGEALRVSLVRALAHHPEILFADEPTAALDTASKEEMHTILKKLVVSNELSVVLVSHDETAQQYADHCIFMRDGKIVDDVYV